MQQNSFRTRSVISLLILLLGGMILFVLAGSGGIWTAQAGDSNPAQTIPPNQPQHGLIYDGLEVVTEGPCVGLYRIRTVDGSGTSGGELCTHGPDPAPPGLNIGQSIPPLSPVAAAAQTPVQCDGDGISGPRTEVIYAVASDRPNRYNQYLPSFRAWAAETSTIYQQSAAATGGNRRIRYVLEPDCNIKVHNVSLSPTGDDDFGNTIVELKRLGFNRTDRKYMIFVDNFYYCGIATIRYDDQPGQVNLNNIGPSYGRSDAWCWIPWVLAHEHMHNLGGVQLTAPNASGGWHCVDEWDVMCYSDPPNFPQMQNVCSDPAHDFLFDCNHDDYYHTNPPAGSYLSTHWNTANSKFLIAPPDTTPPVCQFNTLSPLPSTVIVSDAQSGLAVVRVLQQQNAQAQIPPFHVGITVPVNITVSVTNQNKSAVLQLEVIDVAGNRTTCGRRYQP